MRNILFAACAMAALAACGPNSKLDMDAQGAQTEATKAGHPERAACYAGIDALAVQKPKGLLSGFETTLESRELATGQCAPIVAGFGLHLLDKAPFTP